MYVYFMHETLVGLFSTI